MVGSLRPAAAEPRMSETAAPEPRPREPPWLSWAAWRGLFRDRPIIPLIGLLGVLVVVIQLVRDRASSARLGRRHPARGRAPGHPRRLPDADDADRRHRPLGRRGRLDGRVRRGDARRRPGACRSPSSSRSRAAAARRAPHRHRRRRVPGPPADHDPGHGPGRPGLRERLAAADGPDRCGRPDRAPVARVGPVAGDRAQQPPRLRAAGRRHPARPAADRATAGCCTRSATTRSRRACRARARGRC